MKTAMAIGAADCRMWRTERAAGIAAIKEESDPHPALPRRRGREIWGRVRRGLRYWRDPTGTFSSSFSDSRVKAGMSLGCRDVIRFLSTTTS